MLAINKVALLHLNKRQARREESGLLIANKRQTTQPGVCSGVTRRAGSVFRPAALSLAYVAPLQHTRSALPGKKQTRQDDLIDG